MSCRVAKVEWTLQDPARPAVHTATLRPELAAICASSDQFACLGEQKLDAAHLARRDVDSDRIDSSRVVDAREGIGKGQTSDVLARLVEQIDSVAGGADLCVDMLRLRP